MEVDGAYIGPPPPVDCFANRNLGVAVARNDLHSEGVKTGAALDVDTPLDSRRFKIPLARSEFGAVITKLKQKGNAVLRIALSLVAFFCVATASAASASVTFIFSGVLTGIVTYGQYGPDLLSILGAQPGSRWTVTYVVPDSFGLVIPVGSATLEFGNRTYNLADSRITQSYSDIGFFNGGVLWPVDSIPGTEVLGFQLTFGFPSGTIKSTRQTPPTDPQIYLHALVTSYATIRLISFPGTPTGESGAFAENYHNGQYSYAIDRASIDGVFTEASVPEPQMWLLLIGGFALTGCALRQARKQGFELS